MILTRDAILQEIKKKRIVIEPFDPSSVGPGSVDLKLGDEIRVFKKRLGRVPVHESSDFLDITEKKIIGKKGFVLKKGQLALGITQECVRMPDDIAGWLNSRSRFARIGLAVHITAPFVQPGSNVKQVLEIFNASDHDLVLYPGEKLCQFVFERCEGNASYTGKFLKQKI